MVRPKRLGRRIIAAICLVNLGFLRYCAEGIDGILERELVDRATDPAVATAASLLRQASESIRAALRTLGTHDGMPSPYPPRKAARHG